MSSHATRIGLSLLLATLARVDLAGAADSEPASRPNIVLILADDLGWADLGCFGGTFCETPNIDRLAAEGLRFTQAYAAGSVCSPTRSSLMTGRYPVRTGVDDYIPGLPVEGRMLATTPTARQLGLDEFTVAEALREGGYQTFYAGKWHLGNEGFEPTDQGFEIYVGDDQLGRANRDPLNGQRLSEAATRFLGDRDVDRPFFMMLSFHEPHTPILEYPTIDHFRAKAEALPPGGGSAEEHDGLVRLRQDDPAYASEVAGLDTYVGMVLEALEAKGLDDQTVVVVLSDNGGLSMKDQPGPTSNAPLRAGKGWLYEGGIRVPMIVRAPGLVEPGRTTDVPVISNDLYPTVLALAGLPPRPDQHLDGLSLAPLLQGGPTPDRQTLYWHYPHYHGSTWAPGAAIRDGDWKLIEFYHYGNVELYNLRNDLGERTNLAADRPEMTRKLLDKLHAWQAEVGATIPKPAVDVTRD